MSFDRGGPVRPGACHGCRPCQNRAAVSRLRGSSAGPPHHRWIVDCGLWSGDPVSFCFHFHLAGLVMPKYHPVWRGHPQTPFGTKQLNVVVRIRSSNDSKNKYYRENSRVVTPLRGDVPPSRRSQFGCCWEDILSGLQNLLPKSAKMKITLKIQTTSVLS